MEQVILGFIDSTIVIGYVFPSPVLIGFVND